MDRNENLVTLFHHGARVSERVLAVTYLEVQVVAGCFACLSYVSDNFALRNRFSDARNVLHHVGIERLHAV